MLQIKAFPPKKQHDIAEQKKEGTVSFDYFFPFKATFHVADKSTSQRELQDGHSLMKQKYTKQKKN